MAILADKRPILLAEDNPDDVLLIRLALEKAGFCHQLMAVDNGEEAILYLNGEGAYNDRMQFPSPRLLMLDLAMPRKNGLEVLAWLQQRPEWLYLPAVVLSGMCDEADIRRAYDLGAEGFLIKPLEFVELVNVMKHVGDFWLGETTTEAQRRWAA